MFEKGVIINVLRFKFNEKGVIIRSLPQRHSDLSMK